MATLKELNAKKKELKSTLKRLEGSGASKQQIGRVQYKLNQVMKEKPDRRITKRKTPLADRGPSSGTGKKVAKKKAGPDMYKDAVALDKPKSNVTVTPYKTAKITKGPQSGTAVNVLKGRPKNKPYVSTNPQVVKNLAAAKKKEDAQKKRQAALRKLSTKEKVKQRQKDYRNNKTSPY